MFSQQQFLLYITIMAAATVLSPFTIMPSSSIMFRRPNHRILIRMFHLTTILPSVGGLRIAVIGGGASGIFSSIHAAALSKSNNKVVVFEASPKTLGKVKISGGGRCNVLHDTSSIPINAVLEKYPRGKKELRGLYQKHWTPLDSRAWFERRGVALKTEEDGRMFPITDNSQTIIDTLLQAADDVGVEIRRKQKVMEISTSSTKKNGFTITSKDGTAETFDSVIMATGSSKAGHELAKQFGHTVIDPVPSLFTFKAAPSQIKEHDGVLTHLAGVSVPNARLSFRVDPKKKKIIQQEGPLLITHQGISGPSTLRLSAYAARDFHRAQYQGDVFVHWAPDYLSTNPEEVFDRVWHCTTAMPKRAVSTSCPLTTDIPKRLWSSMVINGCGISKELKWGELTKKKAREVASILIACKIHVIGKSTNKEEFVTAGGVTLKEVDMKTMESKLCPNLFFCGEVLDIDAVTGGFNFMGCWSTGYTAGTHAAAR